MSSRGITKHDRAVGVQPVATKQAASPKGQRVCTWHVYGTPSYAQDGDWCNPRCPVCQAKLAVGKVTFAALTSQAFMRARKHKRWANCQKNARMVEARRAHFQTFPVVPC